MPLVTVPVVTVPPVTMPLVTVPAVTMQVCRFVVPVAGDYEIDLVGGQRIKFCKGGGHPYSGVQQDGKFSDIYVYVKNNKVHTVRGANCERELPTETNGMTRAARNVSDFTTIFPFYEVLSLTKLCSFILQLVRNSYGFASCCSN